MITIIKKIYRFIKSNIISVYALFQYFKHTSNKYLINEVNEGKYAIVHLNEALQNNDLGRYLYLLCLHLNYAGFNITAKVNVDYFKKIEKYKKLLLEQNYPLVRNCITPTNTVVIKQPNKIDYIFRLSYGYKILQSGSFDCVAPYPLHPFQYKFYLSPTFQSELEKSVRTVKIFFSGSIHKKELVKVHFNVISREKVIEFIRANFDQSKKFQYVSDEPTLNKLLFSKNYTNQVIISGVRIKKEDWLKSLTKIDFLICLPGAAIPWSHNCVEAMSARAIPILQYGDLFHPKLENFKNCLSYSNYEELQMAIETALAMAPAEIEIMRKNVSTYFDEHLSIDSIANKIKKFSQSSKSEMKVAIPFIGTEEERSLISKALHKKVKTGDL